VSLESKKFICVKHYLFS